MLKHTFPCKGANVALELDPAKLPASTISYLLSYGFKQCLADSYAGAEDQTEAEALLSKKLKALVEGTAQERASPVRDPFAAMVKTIATELVNRALKKKGVKKVEKDAFAKLVADCIESHKTAIEAEATKRLEAVDELEIEVAV